MSRRCSGWTGRHWKCAVSYIYTKKRAICYQIKLYGKQEPTLSRRVTSGHLARRTLPWVTHADAAIITNAGLLICYRHAVRRAYTLVLKQSKLASPFLFGYLLNISFLACTCTSTPADCRPGGLDFKNGLSIRAAPVGFQLPAPSACQDSQKAGLPTGVVLSPHSALNTPNLV